MLQKVGKAFAVSSTRVQLRVSDFQLHLGSAKNQLWFEGSWVLFPGFLHCLLPGCITFSTNLCGVSMFYKKAMQCVSRCLPFVLLTFLFFSCSSSKKSKLVEVAPSDPVVEDTVVVIDLPSNSCDELLNSPDNIIFKIADSLTALNLYYSNNGDDMRDCSGIFHRFLLALQKECENLALPCVTSERNSRSIAQWYEERNRFTVIDDALRQSTMIKPGNLLFFGRRWTKYPDMTKEKVFRQIYHLAIVVDVEKDQNGVVQSYRLFHGRSTGKPAMITDWHRRKPTTANLPPLGNFDEQWIGHATILFSKDEEYLFVPDNTSTLKNPVTNP